ncbi:terminase gpA endonuclease subunit, partial [Escherichia coli]
TLPFQRAIMNAMGSDYIREVNVVKSARVGYSKMLLGVYAYFIEHKQRNTLIWLPTDGDAENFMKTHVEPTIRDIPLLLALAPWYGKKHRDNTLTMKRFSNGRGFWCLGGKAAKNYREKSVDVAGYDELAAFDDDIEQEGSPTFLGDKRIEGSVWPKSIRGSTPKVRGTCQIERAASESPHFMRFHVACPHCGEEQYLKFGDKETPFGLKWTPDDPSSVFYLCEHNACVIRQQELDFTDARYICEKTGIWTRDGILWFSSSGEEIEPPDSVTFHIWTAYSPFTTWVQIVKDWMKTKGDTGKRKTFVNTTLGETWEAKIGERPDAEVMAERKEHYSAPVPDRVAYLTAGIDSQLDRYEMRVWGWGPGEESWLIDRQIIMGRHDDEQTLLRVDEAINKTYTRRNGAEMSISRICWDIGGIDPTIVYERSKKHGLFRVIPINASKLEQFSKEWKDANDKWNAMWGVKIEQTKDGKHYVAGIGLSMEDTEEGKLSQFLVAANRIAFIDPSNGNTRPMFVGQGDQIFMNDVFLKRLTAPTITSGGNPPAFSLTPDGKLTAKNADISGSVNANSGTLNNVTINENCQIKGKLSANQIEGDIVKTVGKAFPRDSRAPERWPSGTITVRVYDDQPFDRQIVIPAVAFSGAKHERENNDIYSSCRLIVRKNGAEIYNRTALDNTLIYSGVIDMPAGHGHMTLEFSVSAWLVNNWYPTASISDLLVVVMKKATAGITIS